MKKITFFVLFLFIFALVGCANSPIQNSNSVKIGFISSLTGEMAQYGTAIEKGVELYVKEYNEDSKSAMHVDLISLDDQGDSSKTVSNFDNLYDKKVCGIIGSTGSTQTLSIVPKSVEVNMPLVVPASTAVDITYDSLTKSVQPSVFRACFVDEVQATKLAEFCKNTLCVKNVSILYCSENDHSTEVSDVFIKRAKALGINILDSESFTASTVDYTAQLSKIASKKPDALIIPYYYNSISLIAPAVRRAGLSCPLVGTDGWDGILTTMKDSMPIEGCYYCAAYSPESQEEVSLNFSNKYNDFYKKTPNTFAAQGYDAAKILISATEKVFKSGIDKKSQEFKNQIIKTIKESIFDCVTGKISFNEHHNPIKQILILKISKGKANLFKAIKS